MFGEDEKQPDWVPAKGGEGFATSVVAGVAGGHDGLERGATRCVSARQIVRRRRLSLDDYISGVIEGNRMIMARAITLVESNSPAHQELAQEVLRQLLPRTGASLRVGITGVPGAGKSSLIETLGNTLCDHGHKVAVLAIDPSSRLTGGSILGDKTRMETLSRRQSAFIRPSPTGGSLGGVTRKSRETLLICEAAGFDVVLVETVGVGQSEIAVRSMVDFFLLVLIAGAGDELQGMKRGVMELADAVIVNKADGDNALHARAARSELENILHYLRPATPGWVTEARACSAATGEGIPELWTMIEDFRRQTEATGVFERRRSHQTVEWVHTMAREYLERSFFEHPEVKTTLPAIERAVLGGELSPTRAVEMLIARYEKTSPLS